MKNMILELANGTLRRIDFPDNADFTFGGVSPGARSSGDSGWTVRLKVGKEQIGVFNGVFNCWVDGTVVAHEVLEADGTSSNGQPAWNLHAKGIPAKTVIPNKDLWESDIPLD